MSPARLFNPRGDLMSGHAGDGLLFLRLFPRPDGPHCRRKTGTPARARALAILLTHHGDM